MIGILSDAHGNRAAFDRAVTALARAGASQFVFLGDAVGYIPTTSVVTAIRELGDAITCIRGNHEEMLLSRTTDGEREPIYQHRRTRQLLDPGDADAIRQWPVRRVIEWPAGRALLIHGSPADPINGYVYPDSDLTGFDVTEPFVFMGHTHRPFVRACGRTLFINVGSCGLPRDQRGVGAAALFDERTGDARIVRFNIEAENRQVLASVTGLHPSVTSVLSPDGSTTSGGTSDPR